MYIHVPGVYLYCILMLIRTCIISTSIECAHVIMYLSDYAYIVHCEVNNPFTCEPFCFQSLIVYSFSLSLSCYG